MTDENTSHLVEEQIDRQRRGMGSGGAVMELRDARLSRALGWFWGLVGTGITGAILLAANNLYQLNLTVSRGIDADANRDLRLNDHEDRLRQVERDVNTWAGRNLRSDRGAPSDKKESDRGH